MYILYCTSQKFRDMNRKCVENFDWYFTKIYTHLFQIFYCLILVSAQKKNIGQALENTYLFTVVIEWKT